MAGCSQKVAPSVTEKKVVRDSIIVKEVERRVLVKVPGDTLRIVEKLACDSNRIKPKVIATKSKNGAYLKAVIANNTITLSGGCDSLLRAVKAKDSIITRYHTVSDYKAETKVITEYKTRAIDIFCRWVTALLFLFLLAFLAGRYLRFI